MIMTKKKKAELARKRAEEQKAREIQARINIKRTLGNMKKQLAKLDDFKKDYIAKAREASLVGNKQTYALAKNGLKLCLSKQKFLDCMIANFEISLQISDMNKIIGEFVNGMNEITEQMKSVTTTFDMSKAQEAYETALANNESQYEALEAFLATAADSLDSFSGAENNVTDDEIDKLISMQAVDSEETLDREIEDKITAIRDKMITD